MQILLLAATEAEIKPFLEQWPAADHLITGVGCPSTIYHLTKRFQQIDYDFVIQAGIAGSFPGSLQLCDTVLVKQDNFADLGISEKNNFYSVFEKGFIDENEFPFSAGWLKNDDEIIDRFGLPHVKAVTVNTVTDSKTQEAQIISKYDPQIESMEGAAFHYVCLREKISFMQLRSISNHVSERDKSKWKMKEAIENLNRDLIKIIDELTNK